MTLQFMSLDTSPQIPLYFRLDNIDIQDACYADGADPRILIPMHPSSGGWISPVAIANGDCDVIANEPYTWGELKALYGSSNREVTP